MEPTVGRRGGWARAVAGEGEETTDRKNSMRKICRCTSQVRERWEEYFKELLREEFPRREAEEEQPTEGPIPPWTQEEVREAIGKMKLGKAAGPDGVPVDLEGAWGPRNQLADAQKGDASECSNYRGIKLISHTMKIYERLVDSRLMEMVPISQVQWCFMPEMSTTDAIFIARQVMEKYREKRKPCYLAFLDLEKAYDRLARTVIWNAFRGPGTSDHGHKEHVRGLESGDTNSTRGDKESGHHSGVHHLEEGPLKTILCADGIALVADNQEELEEKVQLWQRALADNGLRLNVKKTKFISS
ncbi:unnamed protein product [Heligmosomoides polygyrus]|uniref:Reverse transcriptase domain-containing protein n=1 Tax=Heligmosomoides polygyrus TaxID=6339 RepID=A0A183GJF2_HELPZ|nr:unnamed protein product [Heligmosomoides polygyrus]